MLNTWKVEHWSSRSFTVMAENKRPLITVDNPPMHINLATIKKKRNDGKSMACNKTSGGIDAGTDRLSVLVDTTRMQLISPPPEEMLRVYSFFPGSVLRLSDHVPSCGAAG